MMKRLKQEIDPKKILVVAVPSLGDVFLALPLIQSLKENYPNSEIDMLVRSGSENIIRNVPDVNNIIAFKTKPIIFSYLKMLFSILRKYDLAVSTSTSDRSILSCFYAASKRVSVVPKQRKEDWWKRTLLQGYVEADLETHTVYQNLKLADVIGAKKTYKFKYPVKNLEQNCPAKKMQYAVIHCFSKGEYKNLREDDWVKIIKEILNKDMEVVLTSGPDSEEIRKVNQLANQFTDSVYSLAGELDFQELASLIQKARCFVGVDTCVTHIASTLDVPTIAIHGASNTKKWGPWPSQCEERSPFTNEAGMQIVKNVCVVRAQSGESEELEQLEKNLLINLDLNAFRTALGEML